MSEDKSLKDKAFKLWIEVGHLLKVPEGMIPNRDTDNNFLTSGLYRHNKSGTTYQVHAVGEHTETGEELVVYSLPGSIHAKKVWLRPKWMFTEEITKDGKTMPRFEYLKDRGI